MPLSRRPLIPLPTSLSAADIHPCPGCGRPLPPPRVRCGPCTAAAWLSLGWSLLAERTEPVETLQEREPRGSK
jgi:hypothetical protein